MLALGSIRIELNYSHLVGELENWLLMWEKKPTRMVPEVLSKNSSDLISDLRRMVDTEQT